MKRKKYTSAADEMLKVLNTLASWDDNEKIIDHFINEANRVFPDHAFKLTNTPPTSNAFPISFHENYWGAITFDTSIAPSTQTIATLTNSISILSILLSKTTQQKNKIHFINSKTRSQDINNDNSKGNALQRIFVENIHDIVFSISPNGTITYVSPQWTDLLGHDANEVQGKNFDEFIHPDDIAMCRNVLVEVYNGKEKRNRVEYRIRHKNGTWRWHTFNTSSIWQSTDSRTSIMGIARDITEKKQAEAMLIRLNRELSAISNCNQLIIHADDEQTMLDEICNIIHRETGCLFVWVGYPVKDLEKTVRPVAWAGDEAGYLSNTKISWSNKSTYGMGPAGRAIREGISIVSKNTNTETSFTPWRTEAQKRNFKSSIALPLIGKNKKTIGAINIYSSEENAFNKEETELLNGLADNLAFGISSLRLRKRHKQVEESLIKSEEKYRNLIDSAMDAIYINENGKITYLNPAALKLFGAESPDQIIGKTPLDIAHKDYHDQIIERIKILTDKKKHVPVLEEKIVKLSGEITDVEVTASPFSYKGDSAIQVVMRDISERKKAERSLRESQALYHSFVEHLPASVFRKDYEGRYVFVNSMFCKYRGLTLDEILGKTATELTELQKTIHPATSLVHKTVQRELDIKGAIHHEQIIKTGCTIELVEEHPQPDGTNKYFQVIKTPVYDPEGNITGTQGVQFDITERVFAEEKIRNSEQLFSNIFYNSPVAIIITAPSEGTIVDVNNTFLNNLGFTRDEVVGKSIMDLGIYYDPTDRDRIISRLINNGPVTMFECPFKSKKGQILHGLMTMSSIFYNGKPHQLTTVINITDRKEAETKIKESEKLLNESQRISQIGSYTLDISTGLWQGSTILEEIFELASSNKHTIEEWLSIIHPDDKEIITKYFFIDVLKNKSRFDKKYKIVSPESKKIKWLYEIGQLEMDSNNKPIRLIGTIQDITEQRKTEEELYKLTRAIEQSPISIIIANPDGKIEYINSAAEKLFGYTKEELVGKKHDIFNTSQNKKNEGPSLWDSIKKGNIEQKEFFTSKKNGELFWQLVTMSPIYNADGNITHYLIEAEDITERKQLTEELVKAKERAEESDRLKSHFLANMSHEIRTPMNSIMGFSSLLSEVNELSLIGQYSEIIFRNAEQLMHIIDDIVLYSQLQTKLFSFHPEMISTEKLFNDILQSFNLPEYQKNVQLILAPDYEKIEIVTDYEKIRQVIVNLVSNAFKYTPKGTITIDAKKKDNALLFKVSDTGQGIPANERDKVFVRFFRGSNVEKSQISGTGLGLSIVKELVDILGGDIWVENNHENNHEGSTFCLTIPENKGMN